MVVLPAPVGIGEANHAETQRSCATGSGPDRRWQRCRLSYHRQWNLLGWESVLPFYSAPDWRADRKTDCGTASDVPWGGGSRGKRWRDPDATGDPAVVLGCDRWKLARPRSFAVWTDGFCLVWQCAGEAAGVQRRYANFIVRVGLFPVAVAGGCPAQRHYSAWCRSVQCYSGTPDFTL